MSPTKTRLTQLAVALGLLALGFAGGYAWMTRTSDTTPPPQCHPHRVDRRVLALRPQGVAGLLYLALVQPAAGHGRLPDYFVTYYIPRNYVPFKPENGRKESHKLKRDNSGLSRLRLRPTRQTDVTQYETTQSPGTSGMRRASKQQSAALCSLGNALFLGPCHA